MFTQERSNIRKAGRFANSRDEAVNRVGERPGANVLSTGVPLMDLNRVSSSWRLMDAQVYEILRACTRDFLVRSHNTTMTAWTSTELGIVKVLKDNLGVTDAKWTDHVYGGLVPWWFVHQNSAGR